MTSCHQLKMTAADGKQRPTDVATAETLLRLVQSVPSPKAEPVSRTLAGIGQSLFGSADQVAIIGIPGVERG